MSSISVVIPAYNESGSVRRIIGSVRDFMTAEKIEHEIIVVDDHSLDNTAEEARAGGATVFTHPVNRGYGASLTTGIKKAKFDNILIMDADGTYPIAEAKKLLPYMNDFDMVVGARQGKYYHGSFIKRISRSIFYFLLMYVTGEKVADANSGMRIFKKSVVMQFEDDFCAGFSFTTTITIILLSNRYLIKFVPIEYMMRTGSSKVRHLRDTVRTIQILLQTVTYYNPIKAFLPFSILSLFVFIMLSIKWIFGAADDLCGISAIVSFLASMLFMSFGMVSYVIVKSGRQKKV